MYGIYTVLLLLGGLVLLPYLLWRCLRGATYHQALSERLGLITLPACIRHAPHGCLWFHAASVGEVHNVRPVVAAVHARMPTLPILVSTFTPTGKQAAIRLVSEAAAVFVLPLDLPWMMRRLVRQMTPRALIVQETELWPHLFYIVSQQSCPIIVVNGRLSPRSFRRYRWLRPLMRRVLTQVDLILAQSQSSAERFQALGAPRQRLHITGNTNIDRAFHATASRPLPHPLAREVVKRRVILAGSTHEGEETALLNVYQQLRTEFPDVVLILAPRHLERVRTVIHHIHRAHEQAVRWSQGDTLPASTRQNAVIVLDTMGELAALYQLCTLAFIGGSLVPIGGHNILEPAVFAKPILFGPHMHHFPELAALLCQAGGAIQVQDADDLYPHMRRLLADPLQRDQMGQQAWRSLAANRGALDRTTEAICTMLGSPI